MDQAYSSPRSRHRCSAVTSPLMTNSSSPARATRKPPSTKSSTECPYLIGRRVPRVGTVGRTGGRRRPGRSRRTNDCSESLSAWRRDTLYHPCFVYVCERMEKERKKKTGRSGGRTREPRGKSKSLELWPNLKPFLLL